MQILEAEKDKRNMRCNKLTLLVRLYNSRTVLPFLKVSGSNLGRVTGCTKLLGSPQYLQTNFRSVFK
jgi:hypothetical protein